LQSNRYDADKIERGISMKKNLLARALCVMLAVLLVVAVPVVPGHGVESDGGTTIIVPFDELPDDGGGEY